jgi:hypothetical protein
MVYVDRYGRLAIPSKGSHLEHMPGMRFSTDSSKFSLCLLLCSLMLRESFLGPQGTGINHERIVALWTCVQAS